MESAVAVHTKCSGAPITRQCLAALEVRDGALAHVPFFLNAVPTVLDARPNGAYPDHCCPLTC
jgi:hypothetical protein